MERLSFTEDSKYDGLEASIHLARYSFVRELCVGKNVLDLACGEGYGSKLMADWGARRVVGVDVSHEAIQRARSVFGSPGVEYLEADAGRLPDLFPNQRFELIVSLETIEHVPTPAQLLEDFKELLDPDGVLVVSCPNDWWYYPSEGEHNPHHLRKYTFSEFQSFSEGVLGRARAWYLGGPQAGFLNVRVDEVKEADSFSSQTLMLDATRISNAMVLPSERSMGPRADAASYFVGVWSRRENLVLDGQMGSAMMPLSMDAFKDGFFRQTTDSIHELRRDLSIARTRLEHVEKDGVLLVDDAPLATRLNQIEMLRADLRRRDEQRDVGAGMDGAVDSQIRNALLREEACELEKACLQARLDSVQRESARRIETLEKSEGLALQQETLMRQKLMAAQAALRHSVATEQSLRDVKRRDADTIDDLNRRLNEEQAAIHRLTAHAHALHIEAMRYRRLRDAIPAGPRRLVLRVLRAIKGAGKRWTVR